MDFRTWLQNQSPDVRGSALEWVGGDYTGSGWTGINRPEFNEYHTSADNNDAQAQEVGRQYLEGLYAQYVAGKGNTLGVYTTSGSGSSYNPQEAALYDQAIAQANSGLGRLGTQENIGLANISDSYNTALNTLRSGKAIADRDYNTNKLQTTQDNISARSNIDFNTGRQANALQRLLGSRGSGRSSAAIQAAPYAAALQGTQQRRGVADAYAKNQQSLDTTYGDFNTNYDLQVQDAGVQKDRSERELKAGILDKRNSLLSTLADLNSRRASLVGGNAVGSAQPFLDQINANNNQIDNYGYQFSNRVNVQNPKYTAPELAKYNVEAPQAAQLNGGSALTSSINPTYLSLLMNGRKKQELSF